MKILHVASSYPLHDGDGNAPFMGEMLQALASRDHEVKIVVPRVSGLTEGLRSGVEVIGAPHAPQPLQLWGYGRSLNGAGRIRLVSALLTPVVLTSMGIRLRSELGNPAADVVHLHWVLPSGLLAMSLPPWVPVVVSIHGADAGVSAGKLRPVAKGILNRADAVVAASSSSLDQIGRLALIEDKRYVIPHGANQALMLSYSQASAREELQIDTGVRMVLGVGRLVKKKGFGYLLRAIQTIEDRSVSLYIVGDGPQRDELMDAIPDHMAARVHLVGAQQRTDVAKWFAASDVVVIPANPQSSDIDTGPVVLVEALAAGKPVVSTPIGMATDLIRDGVNGFLVSPGDPDALANAIIRALTRTAELGRGATETFAEIGGWGRVADDLEGVYRKAIEHRLIARTPD